jgi:WD40 repeat protein
LILGKRVTFSLACALVLGAALAPQAAAKSQRLPALQPIQRQVVKLPADLTQAYMPQWAPDGEHLLFPFIGTASAGQPGAAPGSVPSQLGIIKPDGSDFHCLSCGTDTIQGLKAEPEGVYGFGKQFPFPDGKRVMVTVVPPGGDTASFGYTVLECLPSIYDCQTHTVSSIRLPTESSEALVQNREGRISPDGSLFAWTEVRVDEGPVMAIGRLERTGDHYVVTDARSLNPPYTLNDQSAGWRLGGQQYELKRFSFNDHTLTFAGMNTTQNYDTFALDLRNGKIRKLTTSPEWDEDDQFSPGQRWLVQLSSHGLERMAPFTQIPRPPFIDFSSFIQVGRYMLQHIGVESCMLEPWLMSSRGQVGGYYGQPINVGLPKGWRTKAVTSWSPDGTRIAFNELRVPPATDPSIRTQRLVVATLPAEKARPIRKPGTMAFPEWAEPLSSWHGVPGRQIKDQVVHGEKSGTATLNYFGSYVSGTFSVSYDNYSDDGLHFLDGTETLKTELATNGGHYDVHVKLSGKESGSEDGEIDITKDSITGPFQSTLEGRTLGIPTATPCPNLTAPLRISVLGSRPAAHGMRLLRVAVKAKVFADTTWRPVRGATVSAAGRRARSNGRGIATVLVPAQSRPRIVARASGFKAAHR